MNELAIGTVCNNSCIMCTTLRSCDLKKAKQEMKGKSQLVEEIKNFDKSRGVLITGGEPTIREDLFEIIRFIKSNNVGREIRLLTNGRRLCYLDYTNRLISAGVTTFVIPLHANNSKVHDEITRSRGSFKQTVRGLQNLSKVLGRNICVEIRIVIHKKNYSLVAETAELIQKYFPFARVVMLYYDSIGSAHLNKKELLVEMKEAVPYVEGAIDILASKAHVYHFPRCLFREGYRDYSPGQTVEDRRVIFTEKCDDCIERTKCPGLWKIYYHNLGDKEIERIK